MRTSPDKWRLFHYPLVQMRMSRMDCLDWLEERGYPRPRRSACIGCPFHSNSEWRAIREVEDEWRDAIKFDRAIRNAGAMRGNLYIHRDCVPLEQADLRTMEEAGQMSLWNNECEGMCGV